jgi:iron-sulfur cluster assembly protein
MINLTDSALNAVRNAISTANKPVDGLRIMVEAGGCAGYKYMLGLVDEVDPDDTVIERDGVRVFVDNKSHEHLGGIRLHFRKPERQEQLLLRKIVRLVRRQRQRLPKERNQDHAD